MTKKTKNQLLYNLHFLKSCGYEYMLDVDLKQNDTNGFDLPADLELLSNIAKECSLCELSKTRTHCVFGMGSEKAEIMMIGDFPSISEDETGNILNGKYADMLKNIVNNVLKLDLQDVYFTNIFKCKKSNIQIQKSFHQACISYLFKQLEIIQPKIIVLLGDNTYRYFFDKDENDTNIIFGQIQEYKDMKLLCTYHPSFLVRNPSYKKDVMNHMLKVKSYLENK